MNIFALDTSPKKAAEYHCDKHVVKMILETAQILCTAHRTLDGDERANKLGLYKSFNPKHPSCQWAMFSVMTYLWTYCLFYFLLKEYKYRYGKTHSSARLLTILKNPPENIDDKFVWKDFSLAMPDEYKLKDPIASYRNYYINSKKYFAKWTKREKPDWFV